MNDVKMFLFARWITTCYADQHLDSKMKCEHDEGFDDSEALSVLKSNFRFQCRISIYL